MANKKDEMALAPEDRNAIMFYHDIVGHAEYLTDAQFGRLMKMAVRLWFFGEEPDLTGARPGEEDAGVGHAWVTVSDQLRYNDKRAQTSRDNGKSGGRPPKYGDAPAADVNAVLTAWDGLEALGFSRITEPDDAQRKAINTAIGKYGAIAASQAIARINRSSYLQGKTDRHERAEFAWVMQHIEAINSGKYDDGPRPVAKPRSRVMTAAAGSQREIDKQIEIYNRIEQQQYADMDKQTGRQTDERSENMKALEALINGDGEGAAAV
jgi:hypothetical protein